MNVWKVRFAFAQQYWKLAIHLIFKTQRFGVNNAWWSAHPSSIGWTVSQRILGIVTIMPIVRNYQSMVVRSTLGWLPVDDCDQLGFYEASGQKLR
jgi:hypothetical protein